MQAKGKPKAEENQLYHSELIIDIMLILVGGSPSLQSYLGDSSDRQQQQDRVGDKRRVFGQGFGRSNWNRTGSESRKLRHFIAMAEEEEEEEEDEEENKNKRGKK